MPKRTTSFELALPVRVSGTPAYRWLYDALRAEILEGRLRPGARLPGTQGLQLGFAAVDNREIRRGVRELAAALEGESRRSGGR